MRDDRMRFILGHLINPAHDSSLVGVSSRSRNESLILEDYAIDTDLVLDSVMTLMRALS